MIRHYLPTIYPPESQIKSYQKSSAEMYSLADGGYIIQLFRERSLFGNGFADNLNNMHIFMAGTELTTVIRDNSRRTEGLPRKDQEGNFYISIPTDEGNRSRYLKLPANEYVWVDQEWHLGSPRGNRKAVRKANVAVIAGYDSNKDLGEIFLKDVAAHQSEVVIVKFYTDAFFVNRFSVASHWSGEVVCVAIDSSGLTACALVAYDYLPWEVVIWDLD